MLIGQTFSERKTRLIGTHLAILLDKCYNVSKTFSERKNAFNRKPFLPFHWLNVQTFRKNKNQNVSRKTRLLSVFVSFPFRFRLVFVDKNKNKKKKKQQKKKKKKKKKKTPLPL